MRHMRLMMVGLGILGVLAAGGLRVDDGRGGRRVTICLRDRGPLPGEQRTVVPDSVLTGGHGGFAGED